MFVGLLFPASGPRKLIVGSFAFETAPRGTRTNVVCVFVLLLLLLLLVSSYYYYYYYTDH